MKTTEVVRYALMLIVIALFIYMLPFLWAVFWYALPFVLFLFLVAQLVVFFNKEWTLSPGQPNGKTAGEYTTTHSWRGQLHQFVFFVKEKRVINSLWKIFLSALFIVSIFTALAYYVGSHYWQGKNTQTELNQISLALEQYKSQWKQYPENLGALIGNNPLKRDWETDDWGNKYAYELTADKQKFSLTSKGRDGVLHTKDDIIVK